MSEPKFMPQKGQVDYTNIRYCPVINSILQYKDKILLAQRSPELRLYPGYWSGISGFLDDQKSVEQKVIQEIGEETGLMPKHIVSIKRGSIFYQEAEDYKKTWIVFPVLVEVSSDQIKLDWEAQTYKWTTVHEARKMKIMPGFQDVLNAFFA